MNRRRDRKMRPRKACDTHPSHRGDVHGDGAVTLAEPAACDDVYDEATKRVRTMNIYRPMPNDPRRLKPSYIYTN